MKSPMFTFYRYDAFRCTLFSSDISSHLSQQFLRKTFSIKPDNLQHIENVLKRMLIPINYTKAVFKLKLDSQQTKLLNYWITYLIIALKLFCLTCANLITAWTTQRVIFSYKISLTFIIYLKVNFNCFWYTKRHFVLQKQHLFIY